jgi:signal peptidase II
MEISRARNSWEISFQSTSQGADDSVQLPCVVYRGMEGDLTKARKYLMLIGIAGIVIAIDQWTKYLVRTKLQIGETWMPIDWLAPYVRVVHWNNTGAAFGMIPSGSLFFAIVAILVSIAIIIYYPRIPKEQIAIRFALALQLGGALGNLIDRVIANLTVTDFISVGTFPVFNVADSSVSIGCAVLIAAMWIEERKARGGKLDDDASVDDSSEDPVSGLEQSIE